MEKGRVRGERRSRSPQLRREITKPMSTVEEVSKEPQYVVDREKVSEITLTTPNKAQHCIHNFRLFVRHDLLLLP